jgi:hypothetical protein
MGEGAVLQNQAIGADQAQAPRQFSSLTAAGVAMVVAPLTLFVFTLWLTEGAPLRPPGVSLDPELGALVLERSN